MFEKIVNSAERLATNVGESRRGFLSHLGQTALGATSLVAGLPAITSKAQALSSITNACHQTDLGTLDGICIDNRHGDCKKCHNTAQCPFGTHVPRSFAILCGFRVSASTACTCL